MNNGEAHFVLPMFKNHKYIKVSEGNHFGIVDIVGSQLLIENQDLDQWFGNRNNLIRHFTVMTTSENIGCLCLSTLNLHQMQLEFTPYFMELFHKH